MVNKELPIEKHEDGTVTCTSPWTVGELLELIDYEVDYEHETNTVIFSPKFAKDHIFPETCDDCGVPDEAGYCDWGEDCGDYKL